MMNVNPNHLSTTPASAAATAARFSLLRGGSSAASRLATAAAAGATPAREDGVRRLSFTDRPPSPVAATPCSALDLAAARVSAALAADTPTPEALARIARGRGGGFVGTDGSSHRPPLSVSWSAKVGGAGGGRAGEEEYPNAAASLLISAARQTTPASPSALNNLSSPAAVERSLRLEAEQLRWELLAARAQAAAGAG